VHAGAPERMRVLIQKYGTRAFRFAYHLTRNVEESRDLVSEAFARVLVHWDQYDPSRPLENWFFAILRHLFLDAAKRFERRASVSLDAPIAPWMENSPCVADRLEALEEGLLERLEREECAELVRSALDRLPWEYRSVLVLCDIEGMKYEEISWVLSCPIGTVRSRLSRARSVLRKILEGAIAPNGPFFPMTREGEKT